MIDALNQLTLSVLEEYSADSNSPANSVQSSAAQTQAKQYFGLEKMKEMIHDNYHRIDLFWDLLSAHFICIANSKVESMRRKSISVLTDIVTGCFRYLTDAHSLKPSTGPR